MNAKFNLGAVEIKIPASDDNPEINVSLKDMSYEVTELSITEYGAVFKGIMQEGLASVRDFARLHEESKQRDFERQQMLHEQRIQEINARKSTTHTFGGRNVDIHMAEESQEEAPFSFSK